MDRHLIVYELQLLGTGGPRQNVALGKPVTASHAPDLNNPPEHAVNGNRVFATDNRWEGGFSTQTDYWLEVDLEGAFTVSEARVVFGCCGWGRRNLNVLVRDPATGTWQTALTYSGARLDGEHHFPFPPVEADRVRIEFPAHATHTEHMALAELELFAQVNEFGDNPDRQQANTKEEDPTGLLNEGFRYRDLETGTFLARDPLGFVDGPNMYTYVVQNPWSKFDPLGLLSSEERVQIRRNNARAREVIEEYGEEGEYGTSTQDILDIKGGATEFHLGWNRTHPWRQYRKTYEGLSDEEIALVESSRRNVMRAKFLLAQNGLLDEAERQRMLFVYGAMPLMELTMLTAEIPFLITRGPSLSNPPVKRSIRGAFDNVDELATNKPVFPDDPHKMFPENYAGMTKKVQSDGKIIYEVESGGKIYKVEYHPNHGGTEHFDGDHYHVKKQSEVPPPGKTKPVDFRLRNHDPNTPATPGGKTFAPGDELPTTNR